MSSNRDSEETGNTADPAKQPELEILALDIVTLQEVVGQNSSQVERLLNKLGKYLEEATTLVDLDAPYSDNMMQSLRTASASIETLVKQIEKVSGMAMVASTQSLNRMSKQIQSYVARSALSNIERQDRSTS